MRKSTLFVLAIFFAANVFGQYTQNQTMGTANTLVSVPANGGLRAALINRTFTDTTAANSHPISTYPFAQIATTGDGNMWVRNYLATGWVLLGGGTSPSGTFWKVGGNMFPVSAPTRDIGTDATYGGALGLMTNGVVRAIVPNGGFLLDNDTTSNKIFTWNPSTKDWGYANWNNSGGGGGWGYSDTVATLTGSSTVDANRNTFKISNMGTASDFSPFAEGSSLNFGAINDWGDVIIMADSIRFPLQYNSTASDTSLVKPLVIAPSGKISRLISWSLIGGGVGSSAISSLTAAAATNDINNADYGQTWRWNTLSSGVGLQLSTTSTASTDAGHTLFGIDMQGANANSNQTTYAASFVNSHTGTTSTNIGLLLQAYGGTNNYPLDLGVEGSNLGRMRLNGSTSGSIVIQPAAAAGTYTLTLPTTDGNSGEFLQTNGSGALTWAAASGGTPAGSNKQVQYNSSGSFAGAAGVEIGNTNNRLYLQGQATTEVPLIIQAVSSQSAGLIQFKNSSGTVKASMISDGSRFGFGQAAAVDGVVQILTQGGLTKPITWSDGKHIGRIKATGSLSSIGTSNTTPFALVYNTSEKLRVDANGTQLNSRLRQAQGADVASANNLSLGTDGNAFEITGTTTINLISNTNWQNGSEVTLLFTSTATLTDGTANSGTDIGMELSGNTNFTASAGSTLTLILSEIGGTQRWREKCRSVN